ncbi:unnamed protein product [Trichobilharzia regenti]|nr:unnamed protein product [Trichobilharzia regenti]
MDSHSRQEVICYESKWLQPVSTNRPTPSSPVNESLNQLYDDSKPYDPDKFLWSGNPFGSQSPPPSDDATAQGPGKLCH